MRHKSTLAVPKKMFELSGSTFNCNLTKPNKTKVNIPCTNPVGGSLDLTQTETTITRLLA